MNEAVPVPRIMAAGQYQDRGTWSYLVTEYCSGHTLNDVRSEITRDELMSISRRVGLVVKALHETDVGAFDGLHTGESWDDLVDRRGREVLAELFDRGLIGPRVVEELADILCDAIINSKRNPRTVVHGDLESDHILLDRMDGEWRVTSVIDFGDAKIGVRDYEWMPLWLGLFDRDIEAIRAFLDAYDPSLLADSEVSPSRHGMDSAPRLRHQGRCRLTQEDRGRAPGRDVQWVAGCSLGWSDNLAKNLVGLRRVGRAPAHVTWWKTSRRYSMVAPVQAMPSDGEVRGTV